MASLQNLLLFRECRNYLDRGARVTVRGSSTVVREMADNDYTTYSSADDVDVDISDGNAATRVDAILVKYKGDLRNYRVTPTGGSGSAVTRAVPDTVTDFYGDSVSLEVAGFKHDLFLLSSPFTATSVRLAFTGTDVEIYEVMLLELLQEIDANESDIVRLDTAYVDRGAQQDTPPTGFLSRSPGPGDPREKRHLALTIKVVPGKTLVENVDEFLYKLENSPRMVLAEAFSEDPSGVYPAIVSSRRISTRYRTDWKWHGHWVSFETREQ